MSLKRTFAPFAFLLILATAVVPACAQEGEDEALPMNDNRSTASYAIGFNIGSNMSRQGIDFDVERLIAGLRDGMAGKASAMPEEEMKAAMQEFQKQVMAEQQAKMAQQAAENEAAGKAFLEENAQREGVNVTDSGLQYEVIEEGTGAQPAAGDTVVVQYTGTLIDGTKFDSSRDRGEAATFPVDGVIPGFSEGLKLMKKGGKAKIYIPGNLGYGPQGAGATIPPNATLIFDLELVDVQKGAGQAAPMGDEGMGDEGMEDGGMDGGGR